MLVTITNPKNDKSISATMEFIKSMKKTDVEL